ncbi:hypothetical protein OHC51_03485 [Stenotrophomonas indicatrix]|uniref:hypothetical protein n=1 Tax=Stenotrophomonas indicatrix TaxID=2045451 RepID=UPI003009ABD2
MKSQNRWFILLWVWVLKRKVSNIAATKQMLDSVAFACVSRSELSSIRAKMMVASILTSLSIGKGADERNNRDGMAPLSAVSSGLRKGLGWAISIRQGACHPHR